MKHLFLVGIVVLVPALAHADDGPAITGDAWYRSEPVHIGLGTSSELGSGLFGLPHGPSLVVSPLVAGGDLAELRLDIGIIDTPEPLGRLGVSFRLLDESLWMVEAEPNAQLSLLDGSLARVNVPLRVSWLRILGVETGVTAPLGDLRAGWEVPLTAFVRFPMCEAFAFTAAVTYPLLHGTTERDPILTLGVEVTHW